MEIEIELSQRIYVDYVDTLTGVFLRNADANDFAGIHVVEAHRGLSFPVLFVYGRNDVSVPFFGCKVFPSDLDQIIHQDWHLAKNLNSFQIQNVEDQKFNRFLHLHLEQAEGSNEPLGDLHAVFYEGLVRVNQDFQEITKMITSQHVRVSIYPYRTGLFASRDIRVKSRYITETH